MKDKEGNPDPARNLHYTGEPVEDSKIELAKKIKALGDKLTHIKNIVEETSLSWQDDFLNLLDVEELFGNSAEKIAEFIISSSSTGKP